ncbi:S-layer homology domain-containing protein [Flavonifractor plautii]|nr:S-layer homology domain-containing protein [Flavonifractor plautii]
MVNYAMDFDDVDEDQWYTEAVRWAASEGIVTGTGKGFSPDAALTRESLAAILFRYAGGQADADQLGSYADGVSVSAWAREAMNWAVAQGLITGKSGGSWTPAARPAALRYPPSSCATCRAPRPNAFSGILPSCVPG